MNAVRLASILCILDLGAFLVLSPEPVEAFQYQMSTSLGFQVNMFLLVGVTYAWYQLSLGIAPSAFLVRPKRLPYLACFIVCLRILGPCGWLAWQVSLSQDVKTKFRTLEGKFNLARSRVEAKDWGGARVAISAATEIAKSIKTQDERALALASSSTGHAEVLFQEILSRVRNRILGQLRDRQVATPEGASLLKDCRMHLSRGEAYGSELPDRFPQGKQIKKRLAILRRNLENLFGRAQDEFNRRQLALASSSEL